MTEALKNQGSNDLKISNVPYELFLSVVDTVPFPPKFIEASFLAGGVSPPERYGEDSNKDRERYLKECKQNGIIPFTNLDFQYDRENQLFVPDRHQDKINTSKYFSGEQAKSNEIDALFKGGKIHRFEFKSLVSDFDESMFPEFKKCLENLSREDYQMMHADLTLEVYSRRGYGEGTFGDSEIYLETLRKDPLERRVRVKLGGRNTSDEMKEKVTEWFEGLKQKYSSH